MYRVLLVEDEMLVRVGIKNLIDWNKFNMTIIADVPNGQAALEVYEKEHPEVIITDIKMPVMGGMELISRIREKDIKTKIIILTCIDEFDVVRKALTLGVCDYILKLTMTQGEVENVLDKISRELASQNNSDTSMMHVKLDKNTLKEDVLRDFILYNNKYTEKDFSDNVLDFNMRFNNERLIICIMEIDQYDSFLSRFKSEHKKVVRSSIIDAINEILCVYKRGEVFSDDERRYVIVFSFFDLVSEHRIKEELLCMIERLKKIIAKYFDTLVTFSVSSMNNGYVSLRYMYKECIVSLEQKFFTGTGTILLSTSFDRNHIIESISKEIHEIGQEFDTLNVIFPNDFLNNIINLIQPALESRIKIQKLFIQWLYRPIGTINLCEEDKTSFIMDYSEKITHCETIYEILEVYKSFLKNIANRRKNVKSVSKEVSEVVKYTQSHYMQDISLAQLAEHVQMSPNYLSSLFKKELEMSFSEFLAKIRIDNARELMKNTFLKTYEVAEKVGFTDVGYFSRTFKKLTGIRPNEYRRKLMPEWVGDNENLDE